MSMVVLYQTDKNTYALCDTNPEPDMDVILFEGYTLDAALQEATKLEAQGHFIAIDRKLVKETVPSVSIPDEVVRASVERVRESMREACSDGDCPSWLAEMLIRNMGQHQAEKFGKPLIGMEPEGTA